MTGYGTERARNGGWLGPVSQPIPPQSVFALIKLNQVHWSVLRDILPTWAGMVFVVSFSSCLDVAAISMDMGEALDVNNELMTVGISNCKLHDQ
jgi:MFS superfamily sulfate permease-like transporter